MRVTVSDMVSPSYLGAIAAAELGFFKDEGVDAAFVVARGDGMDDLRSGEVDLLGGSAYWGLKAFPEWQGGKLLCALSQHTYWFLAVRADLGASKGDLSAVKGLRIHASPGPHLLLERLLAEGGIDRERDNVTVFAAPIRPGSENNLARVGIDAIKDGTADAFWGNAMRAEVAVREGVATVLLDVRRGDGPPAARHFTFPALMASDRLIARQPDVAAGAIRAIIRTQLALKANPSLAAESGRRLFPPLEAGMIAELIARDAPFYEPQIPREKVRSMTQFAQDIGMLSGLVPYDEVVATQFAHLWVA